MSLLSFGKTVWACPKEEMEKIADIILDTHFPEAQRSTETVKAMHARVKQHWPHKLKKIEAYLKKDVDPDADVISINIEGYETAWGYVYYVQNRDGTWTFIYDNRHGKCCHYAIEDFKKWVNIYGKEFVDTLLKEAEDIETEAFPFGETEAWTCDPQFTFQMEGKAVVATIELGDRE